MIMTSRIVYVVLCCSSIIIVHLVVVVVVVVAGESTISSNNNDIHYNNHGNKFMLGHPTGVVAIHPASVIGPTTNDKNKNITDDKVDDKVTDILSGLLQKYDNRIRPNYRTGTRLLVTLRFSGFRIVDVGEDESEISSTLVLQQQWMDSRLSYDEDDSNKLVQYITVNHDHTRDFWLPDTYFVNEKLSDVHNDVVVLYPDGTVVRSTRYAVTTNCQFQYKNFPFDKQRCRVVIGSASNINGNRDIEYIWNEEFMLTSYWNVVDQVEISKISQFVVTSLALNLSSTPSRTISFNVTLQRSWRPYIPRFYLPMALFVLVSIGCLFLHDPKTSLLVNLINLALLNIFTALHHHSSLSPQVRSATTTAMDTYVVMSMSFILLSTLTSLFHLSKCRVLVAAAAGHVIRRRRTFVVDEQQVYSGDVDQTTNNDDLHHHPDDNEMERIYRSPSYILRNSNGGGGRRHGWKGHLWRWLTDCFELCVGWYKWEVLLLFLFCDFLYFKGTSSGSSSDA